MTNGLEFEGGEDLYENALPAARQIAPLKKKAHKSQVPVIYATTTLSLAQRLQASR